MDFCKRGKKELYVKCKNNEEDCFFYDFDFVFKLATKTCDNIIKIDEARRFFCCCFSDFLNTFVRTAALCSASHFHFTNRKSQVQFWLEAFLCQFASSLAVYRHFYCCRGLWPQLNVCLFVCLFVSSSFFIATFQGCSPALSELGTDSNTGSDRKRLEAKYILHPFEHRVLMF